MAPFKIWLTAFRIRTLPLALSATILGSFLAFANGAFKWSVFIFGLLTTLFLQILSNLANDYGDALKGTDNEHRIGPLRVTQSGLVAKKQMKKMIILFVSLSFISGILLIYSGLGSKGSLLYVLFFLLGCTAIFAAIKYTVGRRPYGYAGLGDVMVFIFFGIVGVSGTYFLHTLSFSWSILMPASAIGLFSMGVLNLNNMRDRENDRDNGKMTLVVRMGFSWAKIYHISLLLVGFLLSLVYTILHFQSAYQFLFVLALPLLLSDIRKVWINTVPIELNAELRKLAVATLIFAVTFGMGLVL